MMAPCNIEAVQHNIDALWASAAPARDMTPAGDVCFRLGTGVNLLLIHAFNQMDPREPEWLDYLMLGYIGAIDALEGYVSPEAMRQAMRRVAETLAERRL